jgi:hypothetical protein
MGGAGMLSVSVVLPVMGRIYDKGIATRLPTGTATTSAPMAVQAAAGLDTLGHVAVLPTVLAVIFLVLLLTRKPKATVTTST